MTCKRHHAFYEGRSVGDLITVDQDGYCPRHERWAGPVHGKLRGDCIYLEAIRADNSHKEPEL
jgi:hypothetical protein